MLFLCLNILGYDLSIQNYVLIHIFNLFNCRFLKQLFNFNFQFGSIKNVYYTYVNNFLFLLELPNNQN